MNDTERARSFGGVAVEYDRGRPPYPRTAVDWLVAAEPCKVVDLGAGTGKLTAALVSAGHEVTAVEPDAAMLTQLAGAISGATALEGSAEAIPLAASSVDAVVAGQAWHWFGHPAAAAEIARVLRPRGTVGIVWNVRNESVDWVARWGDLTGSEGGTSDVAHRTGTELATDLGDWFGPIEAAEFPHVHRIDVADLVTLAASRSRTVTMPAEQRRSLLEAVTTLTRTHPDLANRGTVDLPYLASCFRARLV